MTEYVRKKQKNARFPINNDLKETYGAVDYAINAWEELLAQIEREMEKLEENEWLTSENRQK